MASDAVVTQFNLVTDTRLTLLAGVSFQEGRVLTRITDSSRLTLLTIPDYLALLSAGFTPQTRVARTAFWTIFADFAWFAGSASFHDLVETVIKFWK